MRLILATLFLVGLAACADTHQVHLGHQAASKLSADGIAYISVPENGRYGHTVYGSSGVMAAQIVAAAFGRHMRRIEQASSPQSTEQSLDSARKAGATYLVEPSILHWEDRATEWSGIRDKVELRISVLDAASGTVLETAVVSGSSGWATLGGDHPQDLLPKPTQEYVDGLFAK